MINTVASLKKFINTRRYFLDEECLDSTFLETEFSEDNNEDELLIATEERIKAYEKQEEQKAVILKKELN